MKHTLTLHGGRVIRLRPERGAKSVPVPDLLCIGCDGPLAVVGGRPVESTILDNGRHRRWTARAHERCCGHWIGTLTGETEDGDTIFGADEDTAVLLGRARVYSGAP